MNEPETTQRIVKQSSGLGHVYFIQAGDNVKIGYSTQPMDRLRALQTAHPHKLKILCAIPGAKSMEGMLHQRFKQHLVRGEWFRLAPDILQYIAVMKPQRRARKQIKTQRPPALPEVTALLRLRRKHGAHTAIGHHISVLTEAIPAHRAATDIDQKANLAATIQRTTNALNRMLSAVA